MIGPFPIRFECQETSVICPICRAAIGSRCMVPRNGGNGIVNTGTTVVSWFHSERIQCVERETNT